jgi:hypothetical protein
MSSAEVCRLRDDYEVVGFGGNWLGRRGRHRLPHEAG